MAESSAAVLQQIVMKAISQPESLQPPDTSTPTAANPAIAYCLQAHTNALQASLRREESSFRAEGAANTVQIPSAASRPNPVQLPHLKPRKISNYRTRNLP
jgi:hypothetical protein